MSKPDLTTAAIGTYEQHPIAIALMPGGMDDTEFTAFCEDITERGIIMPITLYQGKVLDGWHRYRAAHKTGTPFKLIEYKGTDPAGYIAAVNVLRRKLSSLQRALVGAKLHREYGLTQREACKKLGISNEVLTLVLRAVDSKNTKLIKRIEGDSDFTRGGLREELEDAGLLRAKEPAPAAPTGPNSVFDTAKMPTISSAAASTGLPDTDGSDDDEDLIGDDEPLPDTGKKPSHPERKPKASAAQLLAEGFKALMADEKATFLKMIWPEASTIVKEDAANFPLEVRLATLRLTPEKALEAAVKGKKPATKKAK